MSDDRDAPTPFEAHEETRFTDWLRVRTAERWDAAVTHRFTEELAADTIDDDVFRRYLVQDYAFVGDLTGLIGHAAGDAPTVAARRRLAEFLTVVCTDEDEYFRRSFDALGVPEADRTEPTLTPTTAAFSDLVWRAARTGYPDALAVLVPAEWVYLTWGERATSGDRPDRFYLAEWIDLHSGPTFSGTVDWLRGQLDSIGPSLSPRQQRRVARLFERTIELEVAFFESAYE